VGFGSLFFVIIYLIHFVAECHKRFTRVSLVLLGLVVGCSSFCFVSTIAK